MKKLIAFTMALLMCLAVFAACDKNEPADTDAETTEKAQKSSGAITLSPRVMSIIIVVLLVVVMRLVVNLDETIEFYNFALSDELLLSGVYFDVHCGLLYLGISHLTGNGALPD